MAAQKPCINRPTPRIFRPIGVCLCSLAAGLTRNRPLTWGLIRVFALHKIYYRTTQPPSGSAAADHPARCPRSETASPQGVNGPWRRPDPLIAASKLQSTEPSPTSGTQTKG